ncbi:uncharacterized protein DKFZp434B061-like [Macrobrachium nipponense]|uniref:uncharacterized protein DKFZp434B061-like n=1 Tax=Macrobrachium nipponense TaxID=159736 RepID=UPI0030C89F5B
MGSPSNIPTKRCNHRSPLTPLPLPNQRRTARKLLRRAVDLTFPPNVGPTARPRPPTSKREENCQESDGTGSRPDIPTKHRAHRSPPSALPEENCQESVGTVSQPNVTTKQENCQESGGIGSRPNIPTKCWSLQLTLPLPNQRRTARKVLGQAVDQTLPLNVGPTARQPPPPLRPNQRRTARKVLGRAVDPTLPPNIGPTACPPSPPPLPNKRRTARNVVRRAVNPTFPPNVGPTTRHPRLTRRELPGKWDGQSTQRSHQRLCPPLTQPPP